MRQNIITYVCNSSKSTGEHVGYLSALDYPLLLFPSPSETVMIERPNFDQETLTNTVDTSCLHSGWCSVGDWVSAVDTCT